MFFQITQQEINDSKNKIFPLDADVYFRSVILNTDGDAISGETIYLKFLLNVKEEINNLKIFGVPDSQKYLKLKIFHVPLELENKILSSKTITELKKALGNSKSLELQASYTFLGNKTDLEEHYIEKLTDETSIAYLVYENTLILYKNDITTIDEATKKAVENLKIGYVFYYDLDAYIQDKKINDLFLNQESFIGPIKVETFISNNTNQNSQVFKDSRIINSLFTNNKSFDTFNERATLLDANNFTTKILNEKPLYIKNDLYFSKLYISRNPDASVGCLFNIDFKKLVFNNSPYKKYWSDLNSKAKLPLDIKNEIIGNSRITQIKILRRKTTLSGNKYIPDNNDYKIICDTSDSELAFSLISKNLRQNITNGLISNDIIDQETNFNILSNNSSISTINETNKIVFNNDATFNSDLRTIQFKDYSAKKFLIDNSIYQYGVELTYIDKGKEYLKFLYNTLKSDYEVLKNYLNETNKIINNTFTVFNAPLSEGYYDSIAEKFTFSYINYFENYKINGFTNKQKINELTARLVAVANLFNLIESGKETDFLISINTLLDPIFATYKSISYFIRMFERIFNFIKKLINNNKNSTITINNWFNDLYVVNAQNNSAKEMFGQTTDNDTKLTGYLYIENEDAIGVSKISKSQLTDLLTLQEKLYGSRNNSGIYSLGPIQILAQNHNFYLYSENFDQYQFIYLDLVAYNKNKFINLKHKIGNLSNIANVKAQVYKKSSENILNSFGITTNNIYELKNDDYIKNQTTDGFASVYIDNPLVRTEYLNEAILHSIYSNNFKKMSSNKLEFTFNNNLNNTPWQIINLNSNNIQDANFSSEEERTKLYSNLNTSSKAKILFNTIHNIEYLKYNEDVKKEEWLLLDDTVFNSITNEKEIFCRLQLWQDKKSSIDKFEDINLPIFNKYFIISNITSNDFSSYASNRKNLFKALTSDSYLVQNRFQPNNIQPLGYKTDDYLTDVSTQTTTRLKIPDLSKIAIPPNSPAAAPQPAQPIVLTARVVNAFDGVEYGANLSSDYYYIKEQLKLNIQFVDPQNRQHVIKYSFRFDGTTIPGLDGTYSQDEVIQIPKKLNQPANLTATNALKNKVMDVLVTAYEKGTNNIIKQAVSPPYMVKALKTTASNMYTDVNNAKKSIASGAYITHPAYNSTPKNVLE